MAGKGLIHRKTKQPTNILSKFIVLCLSYFVVNFLKLKLILFYNSHLLLYSNIPNFASTL